jgi:ribosomal protein L11 methyltransferase
MTWQVTLPCTRAEGERIQHDVENLDLLGAPALVATEETAEQWRLDAYFENRPGDKAMAALIALVPSAKGTRAKARLVAEQDWVTLSQAGLEPIRAGRFFVHTPAHRDAAPAGAVRLEVDAGRALRDGAPRDDDGCLIALVLLSGRGSWRAT